MGNYNNIYCCLNRKDGIINICEMKFSANPYIITKDYEDNLRKKAAVFQYESKTRKAIHLVLVTTIELVKNKHSGIIQNTILLDDLFQ